MRREPRQLPRPSWGWQDSAACKGLSLNLFFGVDNERSAVRKVREEEAIRVCSRCPVKRECLDFAVDGPNPQKSGVWGAMTEEQRVAERRRRQRRAAAA